MNLFFIDVKKNSPNQSLQETDRSRVTTVLNGLLRIPTSVNTYELTQVSDLMPAEHVAKVL